MEQPKTGCERCGLCCERWGQIRPDENGRCSMLKYKDEKAVCEIYEDRPQKCRDYPVVGKETCLKEKREEIQKLKIRIEKLEEK